MNHTNSAGEVGVVRNQDEEGLREEEMRAVSPLGGRCCLNVLLLVN